VVKKGQRYRSFPIHLMALEHSPEEYEDLKIGFSVPARIHRSAVMRNRLKRRMREAIRPLIPSLLEKKRATGLSLMFVHVGPEESDQALIHLKIKILLERFTEHTPIPSSHEH
jgi:ribonuclease P protein component